ncbi:hypothetical protein BBAL3_401 [Brevundimonas sp. BAL3]|nr:hypothetical protein BBAL3_401 [Brevundimonas sp. BAL3]
MQLGRGSDIPVLEGVDSVAPLLHELEEGKVVALKELRCLHIMHEDFEAQTVWLEDFLLLRVPRLRLFHILEVGFEIFVIDREEELNSTFDQATKIGPAEYEVAVFKLFIGCYPMQQ